MLDLEVSGVQDATVLIINEIGDESYCDDIEDYTLPVLQDTPVEAVFDRWGAQSYDFFIVDRDGLVVYQASDVHPLEEDEYTELLQIIPPLS